MKLDLALLAQNDVGEGPLWDFTRQELVWIDVTQGLIHRLDPISNAHSTLAIGMHIGAIALFNEDFWIAAVRDGFATISKKDGSLSYLSKVLFDETMRFNDGKCDPAGRFIAGTMRYRPEPGTAGLYSYNSAGEVHEILDSVGLSNGLCWDQSGEHFFYIDTLTNEISQFDYDIAAGMLHNKGTFYSFNGELGSPDGLTIDGAGNLWIALWGGSKVL